MKWEGIRLSIVTLTINGQKVTVPAGSTVLEAAEKLGINIPTFCHDPNLTKPGACRICVVEIQGARNLPASCVTPVAEGMVVETHSPAVMEARRTILDLILANHPLDCLTCEKAGACKLQEYAYEYGVANTGFDGERHDYPLDDSNPYIVRDMNKCILCGKCVRACAEIKGQHAVDFARRGFDTKVSAPLDRPLGESDCVFCNNCVAVCPVGALSDKQLMGKGRAFEVEKEPVTCTFCDAGCQFDLVKRNGKVVGVAAKAAAVGRPLCLKGRLGLDFIHNPDRVNPPLMKNENGEWIETPWAEALGLGEIVDKLSKLKG